MSARDGLAPVAVALAGLGLAALVALGASTEKAPRAASGLDELTLPAPPEAPAEPTREEPRSDTRPAAAPTVALRPREAEAHRERAEEEARFAASRAGSAEGRTRALDPELRAVARSNAGGEAEPEAFARR